jgi:hypothetical protein
MRNLLFTAALPLGPVARSGAAESPVEVPRQRAGRNRESGRAIGVAVAFGDNRVIARGRRS